MTAPGTEAVDDLIARRDEISRQIEAAQAASAAAFNGELGALRTALCAYLASTGFPWYDRDGKVVIVLGEDERVSAEFSHRRGDYYGYLQVKYGERGLAEFTRELPPAGALTAFIGALLRTGEDGGDGAL